MPTAQELIDQFKSDYGLTLDFMEVFNRSTRFNQTASTFLGRNVKKVNATRNYIRTLTTLLDNYLTNRTHPKENYRSYKLEEGAILGFVKDYENIIQTMYEEVRTNKAPRLSYMGAWKKTADAVKAEVAKHAGKTVTEAWAEDMANGKMDIGDTRAMFKKEGMALENKIMMHKAMTQLIEKRSIGWYFNPLNWRDWHHQRNFMKELSEEVDPIVASILEDDGKNFELVFERDEDDEVIDRPMTKEDKIEAYKTAISDDKLLLSEGYEGRFGLKVDNLVQSANDDLYYEHQQFVYDNTDYNSSTSKEQVEQKWALHLEELANKKDDPKTTSEFAKEPEAQVKEKDQKML